MKNIYPLLGRETLGAFTAFREKVLNCQDLLPQIKTTECPACPPVDSNDETNPQPDAAAEQVAMNV